MTRAYTPPSDLRLQRLLGGVALVAVRQRLRRHFEWRNHDTPSGSFRLSGLDPTEYQALCQLTGRRSAAGKSVLIDVARLDASLREAGIADSLRDALERLDGPIIHQVALRRDLQARWSGLIDPIHGCPLLDTWLKSKGASTLLKRVGRDPDRAGQLLFRANAVLWRLPADGVPRSQLAAEILGDAHALDLGRPVATLVLAAWRHHEEAYASSLDVQECDVDAGTDTPEDEHLRDIWARAGVLVNELARPALFMNLPLPVRGNAAWTLGEPGYLSLRQLLRKPVAWALAGRTVFVCENPNIVAIAADRLGANSSPLVCTDGMPSAAQRILLAQLVCAGAQLRYHGDFDWPGIRIGNHVLRTWGAQPWRFSADDYRSAVVATPARPRDLDDTTVEACWDADLIPLMREHGLAIAEEGVAGDLLGDLQSG